jgi:hypothetical protein
LRKPERVFGGELHHVGIGLDVAEFGGLLRLEDGQSVLCSGLVLRSGLRCRRPFGLSGLADFGGLVLDTSDLGAGRLVVLEQVFLRVTTERIPDLSLVLAPRPRKFEWRLFGRVGFLRLAGSVLWTGGVFTLGGFRFPLRRTRKAGRARFWLCFVFGRVRQRSGGFPALTARQEGFRGLLEGKRLAADRRRTGAGVAVGAGVPAPVSGANNASGLVPPRSRFRSQNVLG